MNLNAAVTTFPFGQYKGRRVADIAVTDPDYLQWCLDSCDIVKKKPFLRDQIAAALNAAKNAPAPVQGGTVHLPKAILEELSKLRADNMRLAADAADVRRLEAENERLKLENEQLEAEKVALRRAGLNGAVSVKGWWAQNFRKIALLAHPDRGGNADLMKLMNELNAKLK